MDYEDLELYAIDVYQAVDVEADIDPDDRDAKGDATNIQPITTEVSTNPSSYPVLDIPMPFIISEIITAQKTDDVCEPIFATMALAHSFFEGEDDVILRHHPWIPELEQIVLPETLHPRLLHIAQHSNMAGNPGRM